MSKSIVLVSILFVLSCAGGTDDPVENGESCDVAEDCLSGYCLTEFVDGTTIDGGMCTDECEWNDDLTDTCVEGEICLRWNATGEKVCFQECTSNDDCRSNDTECNDDDWTCECLDSFCSERACLPRL